MPDSLFQDDCRYEVHMVNHQICFVSIEPLFETRRVNLLDIPLNSKLTLKCVTLEFHVTIPTDLDFIVRSKGFVLQYDKVTDQWVVRGLLGIIKATAKDIAEFLNTTGIRFKIELTS